MQERDYYDYEESFYESSGLKRLLDEKGISAFLEKHWRKLVTVLILLLLIGYIPLSQQKGIEFFGKFYRPQQLENGIYFEDADRSSDYSVYVEWQGAEYCNVTYTKTKVGYTQPGVYKKYYQLEMKNTNELVIYENNKLFFEGTVEKSSYSDSYYLKEKNSGASYGGISMYTNIAPDELTAMQVYRLYLNEQITRGEYGTVEFVWASLIILTICLIDMWFPNLFFEINYSISVKNPEPSDYYLTMQKVGWVLLPIVAMVCLVLSLTRL